MVTANEIVGLFDAAEIRVPGGGVSEDLSLVEQGLDSLDLATLIHHVEVKWDVTVPTDVVARLRSLRDIVEFLNGARAPG